MNKPEIVAPFLYNTHEKPENPNNYSVWIPLVATESPQIYIRKKWFTFVAITRDEYVENKNKEVSDLEFNIIKLLREYIKGEK